MCPPAVWMFALLNWFQWDSRRETIGLTRYSITLLAEKNQQRNCRQKKTGTVILAYPNYWGTIPMAVATFLERYDFTGKTILPLCTNEGSGMGSSEKTIRQCAPGAEVKKGLPITGSSAAASSESVRRWLGANGLLPAAGGAFFPYHIRSTAEKICLQNCKEFSSSKLYKG